MKQFTLWGTSFAKIGDEAQLAAAGQLLREVHGEVGVVVLDRPRDRLASHYPAIRTIRARSALRTMRRIARSDALVVVGAPFFESGRQVLHCLFVLGCAALFRVPVWCYGITVFDYRTAWGARLFGFLLNRVGRLAIREQVGAEIARRIGVRRPLSVIADPRCALEPAPDTVVASCLAAAGIDPARPLIAVTTRYMDEAIPDWVKRNQGFSGAANRRANAAVGALVGRLAELAQIALIPMHPTAREDEAMAEVLRLHCADPAAIRMLARDLSAAECLGIVRHCDMLVSSRLVSAVFGAAAGTPTFVIAYDARMLDFMASIGAAEHAVDWRAIDAASAIAHAERMWAERDRLRERGAQVGERLRQRVAAEARLLAMDYREQEVVAPRAV